jgi:hypothetical protein
LINTPAAIIIYLVSSLGLAFWNKKKGHGFWFGLVYCLFLTPVIGLLTIALAQQVVIVDTGNGRKRSCPHCFGLTAETKTFCELCGKHIGRQTAKQFLQMAELFVGLILTVLLVKMFI